MRWLSRFTVVLLLLPVVQNLHAQNPLWKQTKSGSLYLLQPIDTTKKVKGALVPNSGNGTAIAGQVRFAAGALQYYNGSSWVTLSVVTGGGAGGFSTFANKRVYTTSPGDTVWIRALAGDTTLGKGLFNVAGPLQSTLYYPSATSGQAGWLTRNAVAPSSGLLTSATSSDTICMSMFQAKHGSVNQKSFVVLDTGGVVRFGVGFYDGYSGVYLNGNGAMPSSYAGTDNWVIGRSAMPAATSGSFNEVFGVAAMWSNTTGSHNVSIGTNNMYYNTTGNYNTSVGDNCLNQNTSGNNNIVVGRDAMQMNTTGCYNTAMGMDALIQNTTGDMNVAIGNGSSYQSVTGRNNTAVGDSALWTSSTSANTAIGAHSLQYQGNGFLNTALGYYAGADSSAQNYESLSDSLCTFLGGLAGRNNSIAQATPVVNSTAIGYKVKATKSNQVMLGNSDVTEIVSGGAVFTSGNATIAAGDSVRVSITGLTSASGLAIVSYKTASALPADTAASYNLTASGQLTLFGKFGRVVSYFVVKR